MATASLSTGRKKLSPEAKQRAERLAATKAAMAPDVAADKAERADRLRNRQLDVDLPGIAISARVTTGKPDFRSRPDAKKMRPEDITNIERLSQADAMDLLRAIREVAPQAIDKAMGEVMDSWDWPEGDERWGLTPHELRKLNRQKQLAK